jgi:DNA gyrase/topoisomerase IV subunit A
MTLEREAVVIASCAVSDTDEIVVMTAEGVVIRTPVNEIRVIGRGTKGVKVIRLDENDRVVGIAVVPSDIETVRPGPADDLPGEGEARNPALPPPLEEKGTSPE